MVLIIPAPIDFQYRIEDYDQHLLAQTGEVQSTFMLSTLFLDFYVYCGSLKCVSNYRYPVEPRPSFGLRPVRPIPPIPERPGSGGYRGSYPSAVGPVPVDRPIGKSQFLITTTQSVSKTVL